MSTNMLRDRYLRDFTTPLAPCLGVTSAREALASRDKFFDSLEMGAHRSIRPRLVSATYRPEHAPVVVMRARGTAGGEQALLAALGEEIQQCVDDANDGAVVGGRGDGGVQGRVLRHPRPPLGDLARLLFEDALHLAHFLAGGPPRGQRSDGRLEDATRLEELPHRLAMREDDEGERLDQRLHRDVTHEGALARPDLDEAAALQRAQGLAHRGAADAESLGELALRGKAIARVQAAVGDQRLDLAHDILVDPNGLDGLELHQVPSLLRAWAGADLASHQPSAVTAAASTMDSQMSAAAAPVPSERRTMGSSVIISPATYPSTPPPSQMIHSWRAMRRARKPLPQTTRGRERAIPKTTRIMSPLAAAATPSTLSRLMVTSATTMIQIASLRDVPCRGPA